MVYLSNKLLGGSVIGYGSDGQEVEGLDAKFMTPVGCRNCEGRAGCGKGRVFSLPLRTFASPRGRAVPGGGSLVGRLREADKF
ncbi:hypothetical protein E2C01_084208 [Portunus trituberculatus]|uniref:Uncharacterized protein n=1 Tax=Portunus trituberculatus TaxID=210409 RepID=A0A5B7IXN7_PORTR|nr:hypothetical protein [Portunus trituberculatus]